MVLYQKEAILVEVERDVTLIFVNDINYSIFAKIFKSLNWSKYAS